MKRYALLLFLAAFLSSCSAYSPPRTEITPDMLRGEQYVGLIRNGTDCPISVPSENSAATLIVPAQSFIEYTTWTKDFDLEGYQNGKKIFCKRITASPRRFTHMCKSYDFMAEIGMPIDNIGEIAPPPVCPPEPICPPEDRPIKKKRRVKKCLS
jgi:hypothetical protein